MSDMPTGVSVYWWSGLDFAISEERYLLYLSTTLCEHKQRRHNDNVGKVKGVGGGDGKDTGR